MFIIINVNYLIIYICRYICSYICVYIYYKLNQTLWDFSHSDICFNATILNIELNSNLTDKFESYFFTLSYNFFEKRDFILYANSHMYIGLLLLHPDKEAILILHVLFNLYFLENILVRLVSFYFKMHNYMCSVFFKNYI